jgi:TonB-linked SusC/RagA family outer membrane protein
MNKLLQRIFLILMLLGTHTYAQTQTITGKVTSKDDGQPLPGITVRVKGGNASTQTSATGDFTIKALVNATLVFSSVGFDPQEYAARPGMQIVLASSQNQLKEVIVTSYGTASKKLLPGSTTQVNSDDFAKRPITNVLSAVVGAGPGIQTTIAGGAPGESPGIRIRGFGSISASSDALLVVDGAVYNGSFANINPDDVESVALLKDAATTALYGSRAGNGVVVITTKKGKAGKPTLSFKASTGWISRGLPEYDRVDAFQYYPLMWEAYRNNLTYGSARIPMATANGIASGIITNYNNVNYSGIKSLLGYNPFNVPDNQVVGIDGRINPNAQLLYADDLNWAEQTTQGGKKRQNYSMTYSGGADKSDYFGSFSYTDEQGYLIKNRLKRFNARVSINNTPTKWFKTGLNLTGNYNDLAFDNVGDGGTSFINPFYISRYIGPIYPVHLHDASGALVLDANGQPQYDFGSGRPFSQGRHAIFENNADSQSSIRGAINSRAYATINFYKDLKLTTNFAFDLQDTHERTYDNPTLGDGAPAGRSYHDFFRTTNYTFNQLLEYNKDFGKHHIDVLAGHENYLYKYNTLSGAKTGIIVEGITELPNFSTITTAASNEDNQRVESFLSRVNYNFDQKYILSASLRRDGNSVIAPDARWENFWSVGLAYNISQENFFKVSWIDQLKLRSSYGVVGNAQGIGYYPYQALYGLGRNNQTEPGYIQTSLPNPGLRWETSKSFDIGADFSFLKGRLGGSLEYFNRVTDGLIFSVPVALSAGGTTASNNYTIPTNIGSMYNRGIELNLNGRVVKSRSFNYSVTLNLTKLKNEITKMPPGQPLIIDGTKAYSVGHSRYDFYLREFYGVDPDNGLALYKTTTTTANSRIIGTDTVTTVLGEANQRYIKDKSAIPDLLGSMSHNFAYKNFTLGIQFTFQLGGTVYDNSYVGLMHSGTYGTAFSTDILKRWQQPGDITNTPRLDVGNTANLAGASTRWLIGASYLQINAVNLGYNIPAGFLSKFKVSRASIFASAENLALLSKRKGMNVTGSFNGTTDNGYNYNRIIAVGLNVNF